MEESEILETGLGVLIIDDDEDNTREARRVMAGVATCRHEDADSFLERQRYRRVLIAAEGKEQSRTVILTAIKAAGCGAEAVGILNMDAWLPEEISNRLMVINATLIVTISGWKGAYLTETGEKNWKSFLGLLNKSRYVVLTIPVTMDF